MLKRRAYEKLLSWKAEAPEEALLVDGAREVGKTLPYRVVRSTGVC